MRQKTSELHHLLDAALALALAALCLAYLWDAYGASSRMTNLILIRPAALICTALVLAVAIRAVHRIVLSRRSAQAPDMTTDLDMAQVRQMIALMASFAAYVAVMSRIGFDLATFLFMAVGLVILNERRPLVVIVYSLAFTALNIWLAKFTSYGVPLLIEGGLW